MADIDIDIDHLREWAGRTQATEQRIDPFPARAMAALLDQNVLPSEGDPLPPPWQWLYFLDTPSREGTGHDGHPKRGGFLPPVQLPRRMWAAGRLDIEAPLRIGADVRKVSSVQSVERKDGNSGPLIFVQVAHEYHQDGRRCLSEVQSLVYREAPKGLAPLSPGEVEVDEAQWSRIVQPDPALLFRFSALTYNGHRIHYDRDYAMREEFYPALVVHGPLLATLLLDLLTHHCADVRIRSFEFRALRPAFDTDAVRLCGRRDGEQVKLWTVDPKGMVGMRATAVVA